MITCSKCGSKVGVIGPCKTCKAAPKSFSEATKKARYGHKDWVWWNGQALPKSPESMKRCLLDCGTKGNWTLICADGTPMKGFWYLGINLLRHMQIGNY